MIDGHWNHITNMWKAYTLFHMKGLNLIPSIFMFPSCFRQVRVEKHLCFCIFLQQGLITPTNHLPGNLLSTEIVSEKGKIMFEDSDTISCLSLHVWFDSSRYFHLLDIISILFLLQPLDVENSEHVLHCKSLLGINI